MELCCEIRAKLVLYGKYTGSPVEIEKNIKSICKEGSEEHKALCEQYKDIIGYEREQDVTGFDKELMELMSADAAKRERETLDSIVSAFRSVYLGEKSKGYVEFAGAVINIADFSAVHISEFNINVKKGDSDWND